MGALKIGQGLALPLEAVTQTFAILAMRGRGKTYAAMVLAEEMVGAGLPVVVIDPVGVWWGLRSSADGKQPGLPVVIFGGEHADVPLEPTAGRLIADVVVEKSFPCVIDLSAFDSKADEIRFMTDFLVRLYRANRHPLHVIIDEADEFAPQNSFPEGKRLLGAMEQLVRRGRARGLGCTLITQRPAVLNKSVLSQAETLLLLGMTGITDLKAIDAWVGKHSDDAEASGIKASLPGLPIGTAWVWSPSWLGITKRVRVRKRQTFDSSATPKVGETKIVPRAMAEVDLAALGEQISATAERVEAEDPKHLRQTIAKLRQDLELERRKPAPVPEQIEVSVLTEEDREVLRTCQTAFDQMSAEMQDLLVDISNALHKDLPVHSGVPSQPTQTPRSAPVRADLRPLAVPPDVQPSVPPSGHGVTLPKVQRSILVVLAQHGSRTKVQTALLAGYAAAGGSFNNGLGALRSAGLIERGDPIAITQQGIDTLLRSGPYDPLPSGPALVEHHSRNLTKAAREIINVLVEAYPNSLSKDEIAERTPTQYAVSGGSFNNALGRLRSLDLVITKDGLSRAADELIEETP